MPEDSTWFARLRSRVQERVMPPLSKMMRMFRRMMRREVNPYCQRLVAVYQALLAEDIVPFPLPKGTESITVEHLSGNPRLQAKVAAATSYTPSKWLLEEELKLRDSNASVAALAEAVPGAPAAGAAPGLQTKSWIPGGEDVFIAADREDLAGLSFSGGGVRSATFCLGVMQGLAEAGKLRRFDYLSTVSGGGYIHQWLASWIANAAMNLPPAGSAFGSVAKQLVPLPENGSPVRWPEQISWLRRYSSYLTPRRGLFSADTWTMVCIWFRNTFLNQIVLLSFLACCLIGVRTVTSPFNTHPIHLSQLSFVHKLLVHRLRDIVGWAFLLWLASSIVRLGIALTSQRGGVPSPFIKARLPDEGGVAFGIVLPGFLLSLLVAMETLRIPRGPEIAHTAMWSRVWIVYIAALVLAITFSKLDWPGGVGEPKTWFDTIYKKVVLKPLPWFGLLLAGCLAVGASAYLEKFLQARPAPTGHERIATYSAEVATAFNNLLPTSVPGLSLHEEMTSESGDDEGVSTLDVTVAHDDHSHLIKPEMIIAMFGPVVFFGLQFLAIRLQTGLLGRGYAESRREWLARYGAWSAMMSVTWMVLVFIARLGPPLDTWFMETSTVKRIGSLAAIVATHALTLYSGASSKTDGKPKANGVAFGYSWLDLVGLVGAPLCILLLLIAVSGIVERGIDVISQSAGGHEVAALTGAAASVVFITLLFGWRIDVNDFSMHGFYRNRLSRCYLGCNNPMRTPDPFTGFDDKTEAGARTNIRLSSLLPARFTQAAGKKARTAPFDGPFPIFCATLNLTFGEDLATQERKGASFAFTPLYTGYHVGWTAEKGRESDTEFNGFFPTRDYAYRNGGVGLSTVAAVSGAAVSPNMGYSSQPALAFLMTLFNARLSWWVANPRRPKVANCAADKPTPRFGLGYLLSELFGFSTDNSNYVCLSDGGHFDNMGAYELVRRRCKLIVICDAEADDGCVFEGMGGFIAKARTDFGTEIDLDLTTLIPDPVTGLAQVHFIKGDIRYPPPPGSTKAFTGTIVYLKAGLTRDMPGDILHHHRVNSAFPNTTTLNQWFNETDFESYRKLGQLVALDAATSI